MAQASRQHSARVSASVAFRTLARGLALVWLLPALLFNIDWTGHASWQANLAAVVMILGAALFIEGALRLRSLVLSPMCALAAIFLVYINTKQATRTLSFASEAESEAREAQIFAASQRSHLLARRQAQSAVAGEAATTTLEAALESVKVAEPMRWRLTKGCNADEVTSRRSSAFGLHRRGRRSALPRSVTRSTRRSQRWRPSAFSRRGSQSRPEGG